MPSIDEILGNVFGEESQAVKVASQDKKHSDSEIEKQAKELGLINDDSQTKTASPTNGGPKMNLGEYYNNLFGTTKVAMEVDDSEEKKKEDDKKEDEGEEKKASAEELEGEIAGQIFQQGLQERLLNHTVKLAMDGLPDSSATQSNQAGATVLPAAKANPQLPVNRREEADKKMDTTPKYYDLKGMDGAVAKARLESALEANNVEGMSHTNKNVDTGLETPASQKTASARRLTDLSRQELLLLDTEFPEDMMKQAYAIVEDEVEKIAHVEEIAESCFDYGAELAMQKIAEMEAKAKEEEKDEDKKEEKEEEKTASAMGKFILEGYWNTMLEKGAEFHGAENSEIYIEELMKEAGYDKVMKFMAGAGKKAKGAASAAGSKMQSAAKKGYSKALGTKAKRNMATAGGVGTALGFGAGRASKKD